MDTFSRLFFENLSIHHHVVIVINVSFIRQQKKNVYECVMVKSINSLILDNWPYQFICVVVVVGVFDIQGDFI